METKQQGQQPVKSAHKTVEALIRHNFSPAERNEIGAELARSVGEVRGVEAEFDQVKANYNARTAAAEAKVDKLSTDLVNGFDMRRELCVIIYRPTERKKYFVRLTTVQDAEVGGKPFRPTPEELPALAALVDDMTQEDFQAELVQAESEFERRDKVVLFPPAKNDVGELVIGRLKGKWYTALRLQVGSARIAERLDTEQRAFKERKDAVEKGGSRALEWLTQSVGKDAAAGFKGPIQSAIDAQKERVE